MFRAWIVLLCGVMAACAGAEGISLGLPAPGSKSSEDFTPPAEALAALAGAAGPVTLVDLPVSGDAVATAILEPVEVFAKPTFTAMTAAGPVEKPLPAMKFFRGETSGAAPASVFLSVTEGRQLYLGIWGNDGVLRIAAPSDVKSAGGTKHSFGAGEPSRAATPEGFCAVDTVPMNQKKVAGFQEPVSAPKAGGVLGFDLMIDIGNSLFTSSFGSDETQATTYIANVIGSVSTIYDRDVDVVLQIGDLFVWETADPLDHSSTSNQLNTYRTYCQTNRGAYSRTVGHFFGNNGGGGIAYLDTLCSTSFGYGISNLDANASFPVSGYHWDLGVTAHELGHNFASPHTHCYSPPIDCCYNTEPGCNCGAVVPISGTIMSYCHLVQSIHLDFSSREQTVIRTAAEAAACSVTPDFALSVSPGVIGFGGTPGNISPASRTVTVTNNDAASSVNWSMTGADIGTLYTVSPSSGTLAASASVNLTLTPTPAAAALAAGVHERTLTFTNLTSNAETEATFRVTIAAFYEALDSNPGWTTTGAWAFGVPLGVGGDFGGEDPTAGATGNNVYGYNLAGGYSDGLPQRTLTTPAFNLSEYRELSLSFARWLNVEDRQYDRAAVEASLNGTTWTVLWENPQTAWVTDSGWVTVDYALPAQFDNQATVYFRWVMGPTDTSFNFGGWNIDDIAILGTFDPQYGATVIGPQWVETDEAFTLRLDAFGFSGPTYQWLHEGSPIGGATAATYSVVQASPADAGFYTCEITNGAKADYVTPAFHVEVVPVGSLPVGGMVLGGAVLGVLTWYGARRMKRGA